MGELLRSPKPPKRRIFMSENFEHRKHLVAVRFSESELAKLDEICHLTKIDRSKILRDHLGKLEIADKELTKQKLVNLNRINSNLNQIAKWVNTYRADADGQRVAAELILIRQKIDELINKTEG
jgi:hypothetical protein